MTSPAAGSDAIRRLSGVPELCSLAPDDPYVQQLLGDPAQVEAAWAGPAGSLAWLVASRRHPGRGHLITLGTDQAAVELLGSLLDAAPVDRIGSASLPQGAARLLPASYRLDPANDWEWFATSTAPPPQAGEDRVQWLPEVTDPRSEPAGEVLALLRTHSGRHDAEPGQEHARRWCGVRDGGGRLVAVAAHSEFTAGVPFLASVVTDAAVRGQGLGSAVTGWLTRQLVDEGHRWVTLGMYSDNDVARRIYQRLGFTCWHAFTSGRLARR